MSRLTPMNGFLIAATVLVFASPALAQSYAVTDLGALDDSTISVANAINQRGDVAGVSLNSDGEFRAVLWRDGEIIDLGTLGGSYSEALGLNDNGVVVGYATNAAEQIRAFRWENGVMTPLGVLPGFDQSVAYSVNNNGLIVGRNIRNNADNTQTFRACSFSGAVAVDLGSLGGDGAYASAVNEVGQIIGTAVGASTLERAALYTNGAFMSLGVLSGGDYSIGLGVNDAGQAVGQSHAGGNELHAVLYKNGMVIDLVGDAFPGLPSEARDINNNGVIVAQVADEFFFPLSAFVIRGNGLEALTDQALPGSGFTILNGAAGVNDAGQIAGFGFVGDQGEFVLHAYLAAPVGSPCGNDLDGDLDGDCDVDIVDLAQLLSNYGSNDVTPSDGDLDGDGDVDITDLATLLSNYGA